MKNVYTLVQQAIVLLSYAATFALVSFTDSLPDDINQFWGTAVGFGVVSMFLTSIMQGIAIDAKRNRVGLVAASFLLILVVSGSYSMYCLHLMNKAGVNLLSFYGGFLGFFLSAHVLSFLVIAAFGKKTELDEEVLLRVPIIPPSPEEKTMSVVK